MSSNEVKIPGNRGSARKNRDNDRCMAHLRAKWRKILTKRFDYFFQKSPECGQRMELVIDCILQGLESIFLRFSELKDTQFNAQVMHDDVGMYSQRMAEMLFYYQLLGMGFDEIRSDDAGPDFIAMSNGETFCFEVVTPTPQSDVRNLIEQRRLEPEDRDALFRERLLSVTSAIRGKLDQFERHKAAGHVPDGAHYIIVINDSMLLPYGQPWYGVLGELCFGDSTLPISVDATLGSWDLDFSDLLGEASSGHDGIQYLSASGGSLVRLRMRKKIPTRKNTDTIDVDIIESVGVAAIYQITLREDLMFFHSFKTHQQVKPPSALISSVKTRDVVRRSLFATSMYAKNEALVRPHMSSARLFGFEPDEYNNSAVYKYFFVPYLKGGEFYQAPQGEG
ncbi:MAG TPA: hypothetical protein DIC54_03275 [Pseudomonas sp.]|nr:conserved protein of unknown function [Stenotrophomonas maltophilia]HCL43313.1 hypothetical protein [Pseudomonas sp.]